MEILKERLIEKKKREKAGEEQLGNPLDEWVTPSIDGIGVQTSDQSLLTISEEMPPCTCLDPILSRSPTSSAGWMFNGKPHKPDLIPLLAVSTVPLSS